MILSSSFAVLSLLAAGISCFLLFVLCKISLVQSVWSRRREIEDHAASISRLPQFTMELYFKIMRAEAPNGGEAGAFEIVVGHYIENYYLIERAKREFAWFSGFKIIQEFLNFCVEKQGNLNEYLHNLLIHDNLDKYFFQGRFLEDDALLKEFHELRSLIRKSKRTNSNNLEQANA